MALDGERTYVGFGFGAIQAGLLLYEAYSSGAFGRLVVAEVVPDRIRALRQADGFYGLNIAHSDGVEQVVVGPVEIYDPAVPDDRSALIDAVAEAAEIGTAIPSVAYYRHPGMASLHHVLALGLERKISRSPSRAVIYTAENDTHAAEKLQTAVYGALSAETQAAADAQVRFLNSVIGKMCGLVPMANDLLPVTSGENCAFLVEAFNRILIDAVDFDRPFSRGLALFEERANLVPFEEAKLYTHNGGHALAAYLALAAGVEQIAELSILPDALSFVRTAMVDEAGAALVAKYGGVDPLFTPAGMAAYGDDLLERMINPYLMDSAARVGRDPLRKLGWNDRLAGAARLALQYGIQPLRLSMGMAAAARALQQERGESGSLTRLVESLWQDPSIDAIQRQMLLDLLDQGSSALSEWLD